MRRTGNLRSPEELDGRPRLRATKQLLRWSALFVILLSTSSTAAFAQEDSTALYRKIYDYSQKRKVTRWIYEAIFEEPEDGNKPPAPNTPARRVNPADRYTGKVVRAIHITVTDPFGYSVQDTAQAPTAWVQKAGNKLHRRTRGYVIRELLLVHKNDTLDPLKLAESERLLRASPIVNDASITVVKVHGSKDSVDVHVVVHDKWNFTVFGTADLNSFNGTFRDRNLLGLGQELEQRIAYGLGFERVELSGQHRVYNIEDSYISSLLQYSTTASTDRLGLTFDRPFYSPLARMAGALSLVKTWNRIAISDNLGERIGTTRLDPINFNTWVGRSFLVANDGTDPGRSSSIIGALRYTQVRYDRRPSFDEDTLRLNSKTSAWLASGGISVRQYYKERFLFRFGATEDVPEGLLLKATVGVQQREGVRNLLYSGVEASRGRHFTDLGYTSISVAYGTLWANNESADATLRMGFLYFSDLITKGRWHFRGFVRGSAVMGFAKPSYSRINLNGDQLYGFRSAAVSGTHKEVLAFEAVAYAPYNILGFRFAPVLLYGLGTIGNEEDALFSGRVYHAIIPGILIRNENLLVSTFEVALSIFPYVPEQGGAVFEVGRYNNFSVKAPDFSFTQPDVVGYY